MKGNSRTISLVGLGYVGLCTAVTFASRGVRTIGIDIDTEKVRLIGKGKAPVHEPQLDRMLEIALRKRLLSATSDVSRIADSDTTFLTVGTPSLSDGSIDLAYVKDATEQVAKTLRDKDDYHLVVVKSTVIPGTTNNTVKPILEEHSGRKVGPELGLCSNPEFLKEGTAINDALHPDKIVIGANDKKSPNQLTKLYRRFYRNKLPPVLVMSAESAELVKYASNAFLATKVSFINTIANICQQTPGVDVNQVAEAIGHDPRIGPLFLKAGPGYGGSCFHKDLQAIIDYSRDHGYNPILLHATEEANEQQADRVIELSEKLLGTLRDKRVAVLGLSFKKDTDDVRDAASIRVIKRLQNKEARIVAYDPMAIPNARKILNGRVEFADDSQTAISGADCCIVMTEWDEFKKLRSEDFKASMRTPNLVDARRIYHPREFSEINFEGAGLGGSTKTI